MEKESARMTRPSTSMERKVGAQGLKWKKNTVGLGSLLETVSLLCAETGEEWIWRTVGQTSFSLSSSQPLKWSKNQRCTFFYSYLPIFTAFLPNPHTYPLTCSRCHSREFRGNSHRTSLSQGLRSRMNRFRGRIQEKLVWKRPKRRGPSAFRAV